MRLGWIRRGAAATALTLGLGLVVGDGAALGVALPTVDSALGSGSTLSGTTDLPSTSGLPIDPTPLVSSVPVAPVQSTGPTGPSGPQGATASQVANPTGSVGTTQASASTVRKGKVQGRGGTARNVVNGDRSSPAGVSSAAGSLVGRVKRAGRNRSSRRNPTSKSNAFQFFHPSQFDHLGRVIGSGPTPSRFLGGFASSRTGNANWAPPLLTVMLLIGIGGFLRVALPPPRRDS
jgi:hypothetical protein